METVHLTEKEVGKLFDELAHRIRTNSKVTPSTTIWGIPRGGIPVAYRVAGMLGCKLAESKETADILVDDIVCTGKTRTREMQGCKRDIVFYSLINTCTEKECKWYVFPWEASLEASAEDIAVRLMEFIGEDPNRDGLKATPQRFLKAWKFFTKGYSEDAKAILGTSFENEEHYDEMVILRDIEFYSMCEHHMVPFFGKIHIAYIPRDKVVGISKLARLVECFSRRLQIQERLTEQIANAIEGNLKPKGVAVLAEAQHLCMVSRGVQKQNSVMVTSSLKGVLEEQGARMEFMLLKR